MLSLLDIGLVDEVRMLVCPTPRSKGTRIEDRHDLKLVEASPLDNDGVVLLRYEIKT